MARKKTIGSPAHIELMNTLIFERKKAGLTQKELAHKLDWPQSYISKIEIGERRLDVVEFVSIAMLIGFSEDEILRKIREKL